MRKTILAIGLLSLFVVFSVRAEAADPEKSPGTRLDDKPKKTEKAREVACECCKMCIAAKKAVKPEKEEGPPATNGCRDCCERCGMTDQPLQKMTPPEIVK